MADRLVLKVERCPCFGLVSPVLHAREGRRGRVNFTNCLVSRVARLSRRESGYARLLIVCQLSKGVWLTRLFRPGAGDGTIELKVRSGVFPSATMSTKEIKARLKAAKAAVGRKDFQEVERICQVQQTNLLIA